MAQNVLVLVIATSVVRRVSSFPAGPPPNTCLAMYPVHGTSIAQNGQSPYSISLNKYTYMPGEEINVTLAADTRNSIMGLQLKANRKDGNTEELIGSFINVPSDKIANLDCLGHAQSMVVHKNSDLVSQVEVTWKAPLTNEGDIVFKATVLENFATFWVNIRANLNSSSQYNPPTTLQIDNSNVDLELDNCGDSVGCVLYPSLCKKDNCDVAMTYKTTTDTVTFQMFAKGQGYVSIGFSDDQEMGNDQTITCTAGNHVMSIQHGYNPGKFAFRQYAGNQLSNVKIRQVDGMTSCMFTRPKRMAVLNPMAPTGSQLFDLDAEYYVLIAWGSTYPGTDIMVKHMELPITTKTKVDFNTYRIYSAGALPLESQIHDVIWDKKIQPECSGFALITTRLAESWKNANPGHEGFLMLFAWVICAGLAAIISRYYKVGIGGNIVKGAALWFQSHRIAGLLTFGITAASFILIFIKVDGLTTVAVIHGWFGVALMAITTGQILFGLCRPGPDSRWRPMFNWGHWLSGKTLQILSVATCFLAFYASFIPERQRFYGIIVLSVWIGLQVLWEFFFEIRKRINTNASEKYDLKDSEKDISSGDGKVKIFLLLYFLCMVAVLVGGALTIFMF